MLRNENSKSTRDDITIELTEVLVLILLRELNTTEEVPKTSNNLTVSSLLFPNSMSCSTSQVANA